MTRPRGGAVVTWPLRPAHSAVAHAVGTAVGYAADRALGEPTVGPHPVAVFGTAMGHLERRVYRPSRPRGLAYTVGGVALGVLTGGVVRSTALASYVAIAGRGLCEAAEEVDRALGAGDLERARALLPALVGRDPTGLDEEEICRAVIESLAENTVDAVIAPMLWAALAGAPGVLGYRAVNTMDAMVGHRSDRYRQFGWSAARLDDIANWVPARATALFVAAVRPTQATAIVRAVRRQAGAHPSPNAGVAEAAFAAALGVRLGGANRYGDRVEIRPALGEGRRPERRDIERASTLSRDTGAAFAGALALQGVVRAARTSARRRRR